MEPEVSRNRRVQVNAEVVIEITDETALEHEAVADIDSTEFSVDGDTVDGDTLVEDVRAEEREWVRGGPGGGSPVARRSGWNAPELVEYRARRLDTLGS